MHCVRCTTHSFLSSGKMVAFTLSHVRAENQNRVECCLLVWWFILFLLSRDCIAYYFISRRLSQRYKRGYSLFSPSFFHFFLPNKIAVISVLLCIQASNDHIHDDEISYCLICCWFGFIFRVGLYKTVFSISNEMRFFEYFLRIFWLALARLLLHFASVLCRNPFL